MHMEYMSPSPLFPPSTVSIHTHTVHQLAETHAYLNARSFWKHKDTHLFMAQLWVVEGRRPALGACARALSQHLRVHAFWKGHRMKWTGWPLHQHPTKASIKKNWKVRASRPKRFVKGRAQGTPCTHTQRHMPVHAHTTHARTCLYMRLTRPDSTMSEHRLSSAADTCTQDAQSTRCAGKGTRTSQHTHRAACFWAFLGSGRHRVPFWHTGVASVRQQHAHERVCMCDGHVQTDAHTMQTHTHMAHAHVDIFLTASAGLACFIPSRKLLGTQIYMDTRLHTCAQTHAPVACGWGGVYGRSVRMRWPMWSLWGEWGGLCGHSPVACDWGGLRGRLPVAYGWGGLCGRSVCREWRPPRPPLASSASPRAAAPHSVYACAHPCICGW